MYDNDYGAISGYGIRFLSTNSRDLEVTGCSFNNCIRGVHVGTNMLTDNISITNNFMTNVQIGADINQDGGNLVSGNIAGNNISAVNISNNGGLVTVAGVFYNDSNSGNTDFTVTNNDIEVNASNGICIYMTGIPSADYSGSDVSITNNNDLIVDNGLAAISLQGASNILVADNQDIEIENDYGRGIRVEGGQNNQISCNFVEGIYPSPSQTSARGIQVEMSLNNALNANGMQNIPTGMEFNMNCGGETVVACNEFRGNQNIGLFYDSSANTGEQKDTGNEWTFGSSFASWGALNENSDFGNSLYESNDLPPTVSPPLWFEFSGVTPSCPNCLPIVMATEGDNPTYSSREREVAAGTHPAAYPDGVVWSAEYNLFAKMSENPGSWETDEILSAFYVGHINAALGNLYDLHTDIRAGFAEDAVGTAEMLEYRHNKNVHTEAVKSLSEGLSETTAPSETLLTQIEADIEDIKEALQGIQSHTEEATSNLQNEGITLAAENEEIISYREPIANETAVNQVYLEVIVRKLPVTESHLLTLISVGSQCPSVGGPAVYGARSLYTALTYDYLQTDCAEDRSAGVTAAGEDTFEFTVLPNPARSEVTVSLPSLDDLPEQDMQLFLLNHLGQTVKQLTVSAGQDLHLNVSDTAPGTYYLQLQTAAQTYPAQKLVIIK